MLLGAAVVGDRSALLLLVREGIAAWIEQHTGGVVAAAPVAAREPSVVGAALAADALHAGLVRVLASMAMSNGEEGCRR